MFHCWYKVVYLISAPLMGMWSVSSFFYIGLPTLMNISFGYSSRESKEYAFYTFDNVKSPFKNVQIYISVNCVLGVPIFVLSH